MLLGGKRAKNSLKLKISITSITHHISGTVKHMIMILIHLRKMMISPGVFFHFFEIFIFGAVGEGRRWGVGEGKRERYSPK